MCSTKNWLVHLSAGKQFVGGKQLKFTSPTSVGHITMNLCTANPKRSRKRCRNTSHLSVGLMGKTSWLKKKHLRPKNLTRLRSPPTQRKTRRRSDSPMRCHSVGCGTQGQMPLRTPLGTRTFTTGYIPV